MRHLPVARALLLLVVLSPSAIFAQSSQSGSPAVVPRLISVSGVFRPADGQPAGAVEAVTLAIYADPEGGVPLWQETQTIALDGQGRYALLLGASQADGIPAAVFASGDAHWWGLRFERAGEVEGPRTRITSVPYALRAAEADTLGGRPASDYLLAPSATGDHSTSASATGQGTAAGLEPSAAPQAVLPGTDNFLAKYLNAGADVGTSAVFESAGRVGIGTTAPLDALHVNFTNTNGAVTGLAVQNLGNTTASYSGMLFYDQNGLLGQFQGFNNGTHEYRINNIGRVSPGGAFNGSINFMIGSTSRFFVGSNGNIGIGTTTPTSLLHVMNGDISLLQSVGNSNRLRFTQDPTAHFLRGSNFWVDVVGNENEVFRVFGGSGGTSEFLRVTGTGNVGIGTTTPTTSLEVSNGLTTAGTANVSATSYGNNNLGSLFFGRKARGTLAAPTAVLSGDNLAGFLAQGHTGAGFSGTRGGMFVQAAENFTGTAQGTRLVFNTTVTGTSTPSTKMTLDPAGNLGIGTTAPAEAVELLREGQRSAQFLATSYGAGQTNGGGAYFTQNARGTAAAPAAVQLGDSLGYFASGGYGTSGFGDDFNSGMVTFAGENWTDTAKGAGVFFAATPLGSNEGEGNLVILPGGNVGIGTFTDIPTIADKLQVFGDIRVGTTGTNGCLKNFNGDPLTGTCASDRRFKKDITPFGHVLTQLTALQPVHYSWRAADFPAQHFGTGRAYGLIAQDVEQTLPELVVTNDEGFKAVDYSKLPLLTVQAVKELKSENDALKQRVSELERLVHELVAATARR